MSEVLECVNESALPALLLKRTAQLHEYVRSKIPRTLRRSIAPEDVLQDLWIAAHRRISCFRPYGPGAFDKWLITIADNKLLDAIKTARTLRRGAAIRRADLDRNLDGKLLGVWGRFAARQRTPSREVSSQEAIRAVRVAIDTLPNDRRRAIRLRDIEGRSLDDVARKMQKSTGAIRGLLYNGRRQLRERIGNASRFFTDVASSETAQW